MGYAENNKAKILVVDAHLLVRQGVAMLLNQEPELHACCGAGDAEQALAAQRQCAHDLAIVAISLVGLSGLELVKHFRHWYPDLRILILSMHDESLYGERSVQAGAHGYIMKQESVATLLRAVRTVLSGGFHFGEPIRSRLHQQQAKRGRRSSCVDGLTPSESEVLHLIGSGLGTREIAERLRRSIKTIEAHRANIKRKLNLKNGNELTCFAAQRESSF